jgi:hypothetical protein
MIILELYTYTYGFFCIPVQFTGRAMDTGATPARFENRLMPY